jgi:hypothetical protein
MKPDSYLNAEAAAIRHRVSERARAPGLPSAAPLGGALLHARRRLYAHRGGPSATAVGIAFGALVMMVIAGIITT